MRINKEVFDGSINLDKILESYSGQNNRDFGDDSLLERNKDWDTVRRKAKQILFFLKMDNLDIECYHSNIYDGNRIIGQRTISRLTEKA